MLTSPVFLAPHLPTLIVDQHRGHRTPMIEALQRSCERLAAERADVIVALSARWESPGPFLVDVGKRHQTITDYTGFGVEVRYDCPGHPALARALVEAGQKARVRVGPTTRGVDSGVSVPLHFVAPMRTLPVVPLSIAKRPAAECRAWGTTLRRVLDAREERVGFLVGGLLAFDEHAWTLRREPPEAQALDRRVIDALLAGSWDDLAPAAAAGEKGHPQAGLRHLEVLRGLLGPDARGELECYEPGPGVGAVLFEFELPERVGAPPPAGGGEEAHPA